MKEIDQTNYSWFVTLAKQAQEIIESSADWEDKHQCIFSTIKPNIDRTGITFQYGLSGISDDEDAREYVKALTLKAASIQYLSNIFFGGNNREQPKEPSI